MSTRSRAEGTVLVFAILTLFGLLVLLIGSLDELSLQPGKRLPGTEATDGENTVQRQPVFTKLTPQERLYAAILGVLTLISIVCVFIFRALRRLVLQYLFLLVASVLPIALGLMFFGQIFSGWFHRQSGEIAPSAPAIPEALIDNPPTWSLLVTAGVIALLGLGSLTFFVFRWRAYRTYVERKRIEQSSLKEGQQAIAEEAAAAAARIRQGEPLRGEVVRCYREMDELLSRQRHMKASYLTPREFANALNDLGIRGDSIRQLTDLFELVRYGKRDDESLALEALSCLDKLHAEYGGRHT